MARVAEGKQSVKLVVVSHKVCRRDAASSTGYCTDGGFPLQMEALSQLFDATTLVVPCEDRPACPGDSALTGRCMRVVPLRVPYGRGLARKLLLPMWALRNAPTLLREVRAADAVHAAVPGDVGTVGFVLALILRKRLFVRHCGNWLVQKTAAERMWRWAMERCAGGRNVMLATGGGKESPSPKNRHVQWIFSTSLWRKQMEECGVGERQPPPPGCADLVIACRQDEEKGTGVVLRAMVEILRRRPAAVLHVVGDGPSLQHFRNLAGELGVHEHVRFHGRLKQPQVLSVLKECDLFCFPTAASEGFPKVVLEALACGLPVIATPVSVLPHLLEAGCGVVLKERSACAVAEAVLGLLDDGDAYRNACVAAAAVARRYTLEAWRDAIGSRLRAAWGPLSDGDGPFDA
ncbi:MAG: glycosyltransferase [Chthonomonadales bacterium]